MFCIRRLTTACHGAVTSNIKVYLIKLMDTDEVIEGNFAPFAITVHRKQCQLDLLRDLLAISFLRIKFILD